MDEKLDKIQSMLSSCIIFLDLIFVGVFVDLSKNAILDWFIIFVFIVLPALAVMIGASKSKN